MKADLWARYDTPGLVLRPWSPVAGTLRRLVACCSVRTSDVPRLLANAPTWLPFVDQVVVALGSWSAPDSPTEVSNAAAALRGAMGPKVRILDTPTTGWGDQCRKRSAYFAALTPGDIGLVLDADEQLVAGGEALAAFRTSGAEVGWITVSNPARYARAYKQPRLFLVPPEGLVYRGRHHWVWSGTRLVSGHQYGGAGFVHDVVPLVLLNQAGGHRTDRWRAQFASEVVIGTRLVDRWRGTIEPLHILQLTRSDDGLVAYRLHTGLNATSPHYSAFASGAHPFHPPTQYRWPEDRARIAQLLATADVVHCHTDYSLLDALGGPRTARVVIHHHGTRYRKTPLDWAAQDRRRAALRLCSNLDLLGREPAGGPEWLPNPVPVGAYLQLAAATPRAEGPLRVAHSPSKPAKKGTDALLEAQTLLRARGIPIEVELLTGMSHGEVLRRKAACHVSFDSFWLGIQCSGLEGAAMGHPVIAGDPNVADRYKARLGAVPYTYANDAPTLADVLGRMATDPAWRAAEAARVGEYVLQYHDEAQVAARYLELLHGATGCWGWKAKPAPRRAVAR